MGGAISSGESKNHKAIACPGGNRFGNFRWWIFLVGILLLVPAGEIPARGEMMEYLVIAPSCQHCEISALDFLFKERLKCLAVRLGEPLVIVSGFRDPEYNRQVGGVEGSAHTEGLAVDIKVRDNHHRFRMVREAILLGFTRIGIGEHYIHLDVSRTPGHPQEVFWLDSAKHKILEDLAFNA